MENNQRVVDSTFDRIQAKNGLNAKNQSQLGKLIPMLELGATNSKNTEAALRAARTRVDDLTFLRDRSVNAFRRLPTMGTVSRERQLKRLTNALGTIADFRAGGLPQGTSKALRALRNEMTSLREIAYLGELDESTLDLSALHQWTDLLSRLIVASLRKCEEQELAKDSENGLGDAPSESELKDPVFSPHIHKVLNSITDSTAVLPTLKPEQQFVIARTSVIPVPKTMIDERVLKSRGFNYKNLGGYFVLDNQVLIALNPTHGFTIEQVLKSIRKETKQRYVLVTSQGSPKQGAIWNWIMREPELDDFTSAFPAKSLQLRNWGLC